MTSLGSSGSTSGPLTISLRKTELIVPLIAIAMRIATVPSANASYLLIAGYAMFGRAQAIQALLLSWFFSMVSPGVAAEATAGSLGRYLVLAAAAASVVIRSGVLLQGLRLSRPVLGTLVLGLFLVSHSLLFSPIKDVSVLKASSWMVATATLLAAWSGLSVPQRARLSHQVFGGLIVLLLCSLPLVLLPVGYLRNGTGYQGVLAHPQAFGPTIALLGAWVGSRVLAQAKPSWGLIGLFGICLVVVMLSLARTAGIAMLLGILLASVIGQVLVRQSFVRLLPGLRSPRLHLALGLVMLGALLASGPLTNALGSYMVKGGKSLGLVDVAGAYEQSRGGLIERMGANIKEKPWFGIGFGIASDPLSMEIERDPFLGLPTGAAIEKGVLPVAVLEEIGIFGFCAVAVWLWMLVRRSVRGGSMVALGVFFTALLLNMGENVLFSPGGMGLLLLVLIGWGASEPRRVVVDITRG